VRWLPGAKGHKCGLPASRVATGRAGRSDPVDSIGNGYAVLSAVRLAVPATAPRALLMPFTLAHPIAVLPFRWIWRQGFIALAFGSLGPDIPYFLPASISNFGISTHTAQGALTLGAALALALLGCTVLLRPLLVAPLWGRARLFVERELGAFTKSPWVCLQALPAVAIGSWSHFVADSATHPDGWIVNHVAALRAELPVLGIAVPVYHVMQYLFSILGLGILALWYQRELHELDGCVDPGAPARPRELVVLCVVSVITGVSSAIFAGDFFSSVHGHIYVMTTSTLATWIMLYTLYGAGILIFGRRR